MMLVHAAPADIPAVVDLVNLSYRSAPTGDGRSWTTEYEYIAGDRITAAMLEADIAANAQARLMLWRQDGRLLGCVWLEPAAGETWYLGMLTVHPQTQAQGAGRRLLEAAEAEAKAQGARRIRMTVVNVREGLIAWYRRRGYAPTGETLPFADDLRFGTPTRDDLSFVVLERALG